MPKCPNCGSTAQVRKWIDSLEKPKTHSLYFCGCGECFVAEDPQKMKEVKGMQKIIEFLGIEEELINDPINREAIQEAAEVLKKYEQELATGKVFYAFHADVCRFCNPNEKAEIIEKLKHISVFKIKM